MDYAIYQTIDKGQPRLIYLFTQGTTGHRAKAAACEKLQQLWLRTLQRPRTVVRNAKGSKYALHYDHMTSVRTSEHVRLYIDKL